MLSASQATARLAREGFGDLPSTDRRLPLAILLEVLREPMFGLLPGAAVLNAIIGDRGRIDRAQVVSGKAKAIAPVRARTPPGAFENEAETRVLASDLKVSLVAGPQGAAAGRIAQQVNGREMRHLEPVVEV